LSTATEITRLTGARNTIRDKLIELGLATSTAKMDALATAVDGIENKGAVSASVQEGETYTIPKGYHNGSGTVSGVAGGGNYNLQSKTVTPTKAQQSITADQGFYGLSDVTVKAIPEAYQNVSSVTAAAGDVLANKIIVDATGKSVAGTMPNNGAVSATLDTKTTSYTVPAGYHSGKGTVAIVPEDISVSAQDEVTHVTASDGKVIRKVTIKPIPPQWKDVTDATVRAGDLLEGVTAYGDDPEGSGYGYKYTGTMPNIGSVTKVLDTKEGNQSYTIPKGYHDGTGKVSIKTVDKTATPLETQQIVSPDSGCVLGKVTVTAIPAKYKDITVVTAAAGDVLAGKKIVDATGATVTGSMTNNGAVSGSIDGLTVTSYTIPAGYHNGTGKVTLTDDIANALAAI
jgi:hypothetical protein